VPGEHVGLAIVLDCGSEGILKRLRIAQRDRGTRKERPDSVQADDGEGVPPSPQILVPE